MTESPVQVIAGETAIVTINRPEVFNALNSQVLRRLDEAYRDLVSDPGCRAIVITGAGERAFSAGADLDEISGLDPDRAADFIGYGQQVFRRIETGPVPAIAAVNGLALGGGFELVLSCAFSVFASSASVGLPESGLGLIPGYGGTQRLPRRVGTAVGLHMALTGDRMDADRAYALGVTPVPPVPREQLIDTALELGAKIGAKGPRAVAAILRATVTGQDVALDPALALETSYAAAATVGSEAAEGISAFLEKRTPVYPPRAGE